MDLKGVYVAIFFPPKDGEIWDTHLFDSGVALYLA